MNSSDPSASNGRNCTLTRHTPITIPKHTKTAISKCALYLHAAPLSIALFQGHSIESALPSLAAYTIGLRGPTFVIDHRPPFPLVPRSLRSKALVVVLTTEFESECTWIRSGPHAPSGPCILIAWTSKHCC